MDAINNRISGFICTISTLDELMDIISTLEKLETFSPQIIDRQQYTQAIHNRIKEFIRSISSSDVWVCFCHNLEKVEKTFLQIIDRENYVVEIREKTQLFDNEKKEKEKKHIDRALSNTVLVCRECKVEKLKRGLHNKRFDPDLVKVITACP